jgi:DNA (cytosine-5)-methyltransferase 1
MSVVGLFAGIGGFELGLQQAGFHASLLCDVLPASRAVLQARFPLVAYHDDVTTLKAVPQGTEVLCAGFPCQDLSQAGRTAGLSGNRSGLIGEVFRLLRRQRVPTVVVENVPFMLQLNGGSAMRAIIDEFEQLGYRWAYRVVDSFGFGLPQRRERVFLVASTSIDPAGVLFADNKPVERPKTAIGRVAHGFYWTEGLGGLGWAVDAVPTLKNGSTIGIPSPPAILMPDGRVIKPGIRDVERMQGFDADWTRPAENVGRSSARWALVGSAVSVPVARWIGERLKNPGASRIDASRMEFAAGGRVPRAACFDGLRRFAIEIGADPVGIRPIGLVEFLQDKTGQQLLSLKATMGFLGRTERAKLRFEPGFLEAVRRHAAAMRVAPDSAMAKPAQLELLQAA